MNRLRPLIVPLLMLAGVLACASGAQSLAPSATSQAAAPTSQPDGGSAPTNPSPDTPAGAPVSPTSQPVTQSVGQPAPSDLSTVQISLYPVAQGLDQPIAFVSARDQSGRMFAVNRTGTIVIVRDQQVQSVPFLDISGKITTGYVEQGLLGLAFHPNYRQNGYFFVYYNDSNGNIAIARYSVSSDPDKADPNSEQIVLQYNKPARNHNGGDLNFGPDGYLYMGTGDGGGAGDQFGNGQNSGSVLAKILRINVDKLPYSIPPDNPFVGQSGFRPEIWAWGLRNPWRFSFDRQTGDMYIGDVGQNAYEEIDFQPAGKGGQNYGWSKMEATHCFRDAASCSSDGLTLPVAEYSHNDGCSVTGGYVYRGSQFPALNGIYFFADYCSGNIWGMTHAADGSWPVRLLLNANFQVSSFGEDEAGELYVVDFGGRVYQLAQAGN